MKSLVAVSENEVSIVEETAPRLEEHQVRVTSLYSLVSQGTERITMRGLTASFRKSWDKELRLFKADATSLKGYPTPLGYSCVGRVVELGDGVTRVKLGDIVWLDRPHSDQHLVGEDEAELGACSNDVDPRRYTFRVLAKVALAGVHDAQPYLGATAAVIGLGVVGQLTAEMLMVAGALKVYGVDPSEERRKIAADRGIVPIDPGGRDAAAEIKRSERRKGVDFAIETSGTYDGLQTAIRSVNVGGRVVTVSTYAGGGTIELGEEYHRNRVELLSSMSVNGCPHRGSPVWDTSRLMTTTRELLDRGTIAPERLVTRIVRFDDMPAFYRGLGTDLADVAVLIEY